MVEAAVAVREEVRTEAGNSLLLCSCKTRVGAWSIAGATNSCGGDRMVAAAVAVREEGGEDCGWNFTAGV